MDCLPDFLELITAIKVWVQLKNSKTYQWVRMKCPEKIINRKFNKLENSHLV